MFESEVKDFETVRDQLKEILASNPELIGQLIKAIRQYNKVTKAIRTHVYDESKETGKPVYAGPFSAKTGTKTEYDMDAIEQLLEVEEFKQLVEIKYSLKKGAEAKMAAVIAKNPKVEAHVHEVAGNTNTYGPKVIDGIDELEALG